MTYADFHTYVACIARTSCTWLHEGVVMKLNREKGSDQISDDAARRFCNEIRANLDEIESRICR